MRNLFTNSLLLAMCALSGATTGLGLWWIFDQNTELLGASIIFAIAATTLLQALIVRFWEWAVAAPTLRRQLLAALLGLGVSLTSALFASGAYTYAINKTGIESHLTRRNAGSVVKPLGEISGNFRTIAMRMDDISLDALQKTDTESRVGGTCVGDRPQEKCGPRCRLRKRQASEAENLATLSRAVAASGVDLIARLQRDQTREGMLQAYKAAQDLASHPNLGRISSWLQRQIDGFNEQFVDPETNRTFVCRDPGLEKKMSEALALIRTGIDLPPVPPEPGKIDFKGAIGKSYSDAFELAWMLITRKSDPAKYESLAYSYGGWIPALGVELFIVALVFFRHLAERDRGGGWAPLDEFIQHVRKLSPEMQRRYRAWIKLLLGLMLEDRSTSYFARPIDGTPEATRECGMAALILELPVDPDMKPSVPLADLYPEWVESRAAIHGGARWFALHPLTREKRDWLRKAARDLSDVEEDVPSPHTPNFKVVGGTAT